MLRLLLSPSNVQFSSFADRRCDSCLESFSATLRKHCSLRCVAGYLLLFFAAAASLPLSLSYTSSHCTLADGLTVHFLALPRPLHGNRLIHAGAALSLSLSLSFQFFTSFNVRCGELQTRSCCCSSALTWLLVLQHLITVHRNTLSVSS